MPLTIKLYRFLSHAVIPFSWIIIIYRALRNKEDLQRVKERLGKSRIRDESEYIWIHAASVGELLSILPLSKKLLENNYKILISTTTLTSANLFKSTFPKNILHQYIPYDTPIYANRFLSNWNINQAIFVESEIWPNMILECKQKNIPLLLVNARLTEKSFNRWKLFRKSIKYLLNIFEFTIPQNKETLKRLEELGAKNNLYFGNIKHDAKKLPINNERLNKIEESILGKNLLLATSTHQGEEEVVFSLFSKLKDKIDNLLLIIAPRHPERRMFIFNLSKKYNFKAHQIKFLSKEEFPDKETKLFIYDKIGELGELYDIAPYVILGGAFKNLGGHNPIEPARFGTAIFSGSNFFNFNDDFNNLINSGAAMIYNEDTISELILNNKKIEDMGLKATEYTSNLGGATDNIVEVINGLRTDAK